MAKKKNVKSAAKAKAPAAKSPSVKSPSLGDVYNRVAATADCDKLEINAADTKRVLACFFDVLNDLKPSESFDIISKGLKRASKR